MSPYLCLSCCYSGTNFIAATTATLRNFSGKVRGSVNGVLQVTGSVGPLLINLIYDNLFYKRYMNGNISDTRGFFLTIGILCGVCNILGVMFYFDCSSALDADARILAAENTSKDHNEIMDDGANGHQTSLEQSSKLDENNPLVGLSGNGVTTDQSAWKSLVDTLRSGYFYIFLITSFVFQGIQEMNANNIATYTQSLGLDKYTVMMPYVNNVLGIVLKPSIGWCSDLFHPTFPRAAFLPLAAASSALMSIVSIFCLDTLPGILYNQLQSDFAHVVAACILPVLLVDEFGITKLPQNLGFMQCGIGVGALVFQSVFGAVYDSNAHEDKECFGLICFRNAFIFCTFASVFVLILCMIYTQKRCKKSA